MNNYVVDNAGTIIMNNDKLSVNITDHQAGQVYLDSNNKLKLRLGQLFFTDLSGYCYPIINEDHGLDWKNDKLNLNINPPLSFVNKKLTFKFDSYFKSPNDNKLELDLTKLQTSIVTIKRNDGLKLNHDGTLSIDCNVLMSLLNLSSLSALKIVGNELIVGEYQMSRNLIKLNSNSAISRNDNNFYELKLD